ncbi:LPXTG cell wall anchor domain-containing protein [uncultured Microbacterium sp.]|uniref:LPXTG cell wall anchor domain-containing protein n=1 Tax=uncultured Microbacterium sp. TaxID=191216 RepID=UPI0025E40EC0|nr:LPXTG cell wall anchor domain-containing protein [uncultured Microbacterium sp.]
MKLNLKKAGVTAALAGALLFAAPAVAQAYVPTAPGTQTVTITNNGPVTFNVAPGATVNFVLVGYNANQAGLATANLPVSSKSITKVADASGNATAVVTLPADARGTYTLSATPTGGTAGGSGNNAGGSTGLPATGFDANSMLGIWVGGGALVLAGGTIAVATTVRRNRAEGKA